MSNEKSFLLKEAEMGDVRFRLNALVGEDTRYDDKGQPIDGYSYELEIVSERTCGHGSLVNTTSIFLTDTTGADKVAKFFLDLNELE